MIKWTALSMVPKMYFGGYKRSAPAQLRIMGIVPDAMPSATDWCDPSKSLVERTKPILENQSGTSSPYGSKITELRNAERLISS